VKVRNMGSLHNTSSQSAGEEIVNIVTKPRRICSQKKRSESFSCSGYML
jgi:hypothetical protein